MKRFFDLALGSVLLVALSPIMILIGILVVITMGRPVFFRQMRPGLNGAAFELIKFRTMSAGLAPDGSLASDAERLSKVGKWLREWSLDELPELINIVRGEMSFVGPRPLLMEYMPRYNVEQSRRHEVRPGLTGWAQVNGRNELSWNDRFALDVWYVDHRSFALDMKILLLTLARVITREGISQSGRATMEPFRGDSD